LFAEKKIKIKTLSFDSTMTFSLLCFLKVFPSYDTKARCRLVDLGALLRADVLMATVYKIEHFYSMGHPASQGKICCMLYVCTCSQIADLKRKKPVREDRLFNHSGML
jgi:hypothetical protein